MELVSRVTGRGGKGKNVLRVEGRTVLCYSAGHHCLLCFRDDIFLKGEGKTSSTTILTHFPPFSYTSFPGGQKQGESGLAGWVRLLLRVCVEESELSSVECIEDSWAEVMDEKKDKL